MTTRQQNVDQLVDNLRNYGLDSRGSGAHWHS